MGTDRADQRGQGPDRGTGRNVVLQTSDPLPAQMLGEDPQVTVLGLDTVQTAALLQAQEDLADHTVRQPSEVHLPGHRDR